MTHTPPSLPPGLRLLPWSAALIWLGLLFAGVAWCWSELGWNYRVANALYSKEKPELRWLDYELLTPEEVEVRSQDSAVQIPFVARSHRALVLISALCAVAGAILGIVAGRRMQGHCYAPGTAALAVACTFSLATFLFFGALGFGVAVALLRAERGHGFGVVVLRLAGSLVVAVMGLVYARHSYALYRTPRQDEPAFSLPRPGAFALVFLVAGSVLTMAGLGVHFRSERKAEEQAASIAKDLRKKKPKPPEAPRTF